jgi:hypothetical protein
MPLLKTLISSFKRKEAATVKPKINVKFSEEELKKREEIRQKNIEKRKILSLEIEKLESKVLFGNILIQYSKKLAREILITETFINRLKRETGRPIVVIGTKSTGIPYTWGIREGKGIYLTSLKYPSCKHHFESTQKKILQKVIRIYKKKLNNPLFVLIDSSRGSKMPSSFTGCNVEHVCSITKKDAIAQVLKKEEPKLIGYDWSMKDGRRYLPKKEEVDFNKTNVILFNPVGKAKSLEDFSAYHDDTTLITNKYFKNVTLKRAELLKLQLFGD